MPHGQYFSPRPVGRLSAFQLNNANLSNATLTDASLIGARLGGADLHDAGLWRANLSNAEVTEEQLATCKTLEGATMSNGQKYEDWIKTKNN